MREASGATTLRRRSLGHGGDASRQNFIAIFMSRPLMISRLPAAYRMPLMHRPFTSLAEMRTVDASSRFDCTRLPKRLH